MLEALYQNLISQSIFNNSKSRTINFKKKLLFKLQAKYKMDINEFSKFKVIKHFPIYSIHWLQELQTWRLFYTGRGLFFDFTKE